MNENLSIDEIIKQAEEIRNKTVKKAQSALEEINSSAQQIIEKTIEVPEAEHKDIEININKSRTVNSKFRSQRTAVVDSDAVKSELSDHNTDAADQKTRQVPLNDKTGVISDVKEIKKAKKSFFNKDSYEPVYYKNPPEIIEKPATIRTKSSFDSTSDLQEIPTIVAVDELEHTRISLSGRHTPPDKDTHEEEEGYQIVLDGFEDSTDQVSTIDEEVAERQLVERRREKVNKFRLFSPDEMDSNESASNVINEKFENDEKTALLEKLFASKLSVTMKAVFTLVLGVVIGLLTVFKDSAYMPSFLLDHTAYFTVMLILFAAVIVVNIRNFIHGFNFKNGINYDFPISLCAIFIGVHTAMLLTDSNLLVDYGSAYPLAVAFAYFMTDIGKQAMLARIIKNYEFLSEQEEKHTVETIANTIDATIISRGLLTGEANLKTSIKADVTTKFLDISCSSEPADAIAKTTGIAMLLLNAVLFAVFTFINKNWHIGFNVAVCSMCISVPCISLFISNNVLLGVSKVLSRKKAMINGFEGAEMVDDANAIVIEAQDLFGPNSCEIHGIKTFNGAKADDIILQTAAVIINTKSPLAPVFDNVIIGKQTILPDVDGIVYEDRLGTSAWIYRKKILVGTRELLIHHGVNVPKEEFESKYTRKGRKILYLAVAGKVMAMFVVSYNADPELKRSLRKLEKSGITILVKSADPYINDESIAQLFSLPEGFVRVMNSSNGRAFEKYSDMCVETSPAYVVHDGSALGFVSAMSGAENLDETKRLISVLVSFGCAVGFGVVLLLGIIKGFNQLNAVNVVIFQSIWCIFMLIMSKLKRLGL